MLHELLTQRTYLADNGDDLDRQINSDFPYIAQQSRIVTLFGIDTASDEVVFTGYARIYPWSIDYYSTVNQFDHAAMNGKELFEEYPNGALWIVTGEA
mgnify:CR=1 FL=1